MPRARRRSRAVAAIAALGLFIQTVAPIGVTAAQAGAKPSPTAQAGAPTKSASHAAATPEKAAAAAPPLVDGGWPRIYDLPSGGTILVYQPQVASWEKQKHLVAYSAVSQRAKSARKAGDWHHQDRSGHGGIGPRAPGQLSENEDRRSEFPDAAERAD